MSVHKIIVSHDYGDGRRSGECTCGQWGFGGHVRAVADRLHAEHVAEVSRSGMAAILSRAAAEGQGTLW